MSVAVEQQQASFPPEALKLVENLTSVQTINRLLGETAAQERSIDEELEQLLSRRAVFESRILDLRASTAQVRIAAGRIQPRTFECKTEQHNRLASHSWVITDLWAATQLALHACVRPVRL